LYWHHKKQGLIRPIIFRRRQQFSLKLFAFQISNNIIILFLEGQIPDAALIHAARKRRQQARDLGEDFIPISSQSHKYFMKILLITKFYILTKINALVNQRLIMNKLLVDD